MNCPSVKSYTCSICAAEFHWRAPVFEWPPSVEASVIFSCLHCRRYVASLKSSHSARVTAVQQVTGNCNPATA